MDWENDFQDKILNRGYDYFQRDLVKVTENKNTHISASVTGSEIYHVEIELFSDEIEYLSCTCPHADSGEYCKHMAAVLFYLDEMEKARNTEYDSTQNIENFIKDVETDVLREWAVSIVRDDAILFNRLKMMASHELSAEDIELYKNQIRDIFKEYADRGFVDYFAANDMFDALDYFLDEEVAVLIENNHYEAAFDLSKQIFLRLGNLAIDDSAGGLTFTLSNIMDHWQTIVEQGSEDLRQKVFQWLVRERHPSAMGVTEDYTETFLFENFNEEKYLKKKLNQAEKKLKEIEEGNDSFSRDFEMEQWALRYLEVCKSLNKDRLLIEAFMKDYSYLSGVREYYVSECMENEEYDKAVQLLEEGKIMNDKSPGIMNRYSRKLKDIYRLQGKEELYLKELWTLNLSLAGDVKLFNELKSLYNEDEWTKKRELIFEQADTHYSGKDDLFINEGLYDKLLDFAVKTAGTHIVQKHHDVLLEKYPEAVLDKYEKEIESMAAGASNRKNYRTVVNTLRDIRELPGGADRVKALEEKWRVKYKQRPAMMDELSKL